MEVVLDPQQVEQEAQRYMAYQQELHNAAIMEHNDKMAEAAEIQASKIQELDRTIVKLQELWKVEEERKETESRERKRLTILLRASAWTALVRGTALAWMVLQRVMRRK